MSNFRLMKDPTSKGVYEIYRVSNFPDLEVRSLHSYYNPGQITSYALICKKKLHYIHIEYRLPELRDWMKDNDLSFPAPKPKRKPKANGVKKVNGTNGNGHTLPEPRKPILKKIQKARKPIPKRVRT